MIWCIQRLVCRNPSPSPDILAAEATEDPAQASVDRQETAGSNIATHESRGIQDVAIHSRSSCTLVAHDSSECAAYQSLSSDSPQVEKSVGSTWKNPHKSSTSEDGGPGSLADQQNVHGQGMEQKDSELHFDLPPAQIAEHGPVTMFHGAQNLNFGGNTRIMNIGHQRVVNRDNYGSYSNTPTPSSSNVSIKSSQALDNLKESISFSALHDSSAQDPKRCCHLGTRKDVLDRMRTWIDDPRVLERILWLHGPAGVGKSAIAQTISNLYDRDKVGATFFFVRSDPIRNDGNRLVPTLAWQLASSVSLVKDHIAFFLEDCPDLLEKAVEVQFSKLIKQPFLMISNDGSTASLSTRVIIIDGLDECFDVKLQERILKIIGDAVADNGFPLRFIISSRQEAHIQDFFSQYQYPTTQIDLANVDETYRDIKTYLTSEFSRISTEQNLDPMWPGQKIIDFLVFKSSGQFIYASTVIKYVGRAYESAIAQLRVILGLKPNTGRSPFAGLDALYRGILQRQPDKNFIKEFLPVLVARSSLSSVDRRLHEDDAMLLGLDETQLHRKLRGMCSLLKFEPFIQVHHKSFLDFLGDSSRSGKYHVSEHYANKRYMQRITDVLIKAASKVMEQPNSHPSDHFQPRFSQITKRFGFPIKLPHDELEEILRPLQNVQERLLQLPNMSVPWKPRACAECWTFYIIDDLFLRLTLLRARAITQIQEPKYVGIRPLTVLEEKQSIPQLVSESCLALLLANLRDVESQLSLNPVTIGLVRALVRFDPTETAMKVRSMTDAQNLVDLIFCLNKNECFKSWFGAAAHNATRLAVAIYGRIPLLPRSICLNSEDPDRDKDQEKAVTIWVYDFSQRYLDTFTWGSLSHDNICPLLGQCPFPSGELRVSSLANGTLPTWRQRTNPSFSRIQQIIFEVAKSIQYVHSLGIVVSCHFDEDKVCLDYNNHAKVRYLGFRTNDMCKEQFEYYEYDRNDSTLEGNIRSFGLLFRQVLLDKGIYRERNARPMEPEIPNSVWKLIRWCCTEDPKGRPTIDQVVQEMESWTSS